MEKAHVVPTMPRGTMPAPQGHISCSNYTPPELPPGACSLLQSQSTRADEPCSAQPSGWACSLWPLGRSQAAVAVTEEHSHGVVDGACPQQKCKRQERGTPPRMHGSHEGGPDAKLHRGSLQSLGAQKSGRGQGNLRMVVRKASCSTKSVTCRVGKREDLVFYNTYERKHVECGGGKAGLGDNLPL